MYNAANPTATANPNDLETDPAKAQGLARKLEEFFHSQRQISLWGPVDDDSAQRIVERLLLLDHENPTAPIHFLIHSPGGSTAAGLAVIDAMSMTRAPIQTLCMGMAASFGAVLLASGSPGLRRAAPRCRVMIHQPWVSGRIEGRPVEIVRHAKEIQNTRDQLNRILAERTGQSLERIEKDTDRDYWMSAQEALDYGLVDQILKPGDTILAGS